MSGLDAVGPLLDAVLDPLLVLESARIRSANRAAMRLLGTGITGAEIDALIPDASTRLAEGKADGEPIVVTGLGGARRQWELRASPLDGDRQLLHLIDRTAIEAAERMRVDFVANASHELRTPIAAISGFAETLQDDAAGSDADTRQHFLAIIMREAKRMQRLVEDLMSLSRIEADRHLAPVAQIDLGKIVREAAVSAAEQRMPRGQDLVIEPIADTLMVRGDAPQLTQLAHNLVSNGFKYGEPGTPVRVSVARRGNDVLLTVEDRGEGIPAQHLAQVTQRFYRVNAPRSRAVGGTGLGLAIVKHIVERHRGRLTIRSEERVGTTVEVALPALAS